MSVARPSRRGIDDRRLLALTALAVAVIVGYVAFTNLNASAVYYLTPTEAEQRKVPLGTNVRLGCQVEPGSLKYEAAARDLRFICTDGVTRKFVVGKGAPPALLREGAGAVIEGFFATDGSFHATQVIAKHDEVYAPPSPSRTPPHRTP